MQKDIVEKLPRTNHLGGDCLSLILGLLEKNPDQRLGSKNGISDIKAHSYFSDISWNDVMKKRYKYEKQYLRIDLTKSNFEKTFEGHDRFEIGINITEECEVAPVTKN